MTNAQQKMPCISCGLPTLIDDDGHCNACHDASESPQHTPDSVLVRIPSVHSRGLFNDADSAVEAYICLPREKYDAVLRLYRNGALWDQCLGDKDDVLGYIAEQFDMRVCDVEAAIAKATKA